MKFPMLKLYNQFIAFMSMLLICDLCSSLDECCHLNLHAIIIISTNQILGEKMEKFVFPYRILHMF